MSTRPRQLYVQYLDTAALVDCVINIERKLSTPDEQLLESTHDLLAVIRDDIINELARRQLQLPGLAAVPTAM